MICRNCGKKFKACGNCNPDIFYWKQYYCSINCFKDYIKNGGDKMRIQKNGKMYSIEKYNYKSGIYELADGEKLKESDIDVFVLTKKEFNELKKFKVKEIKEEEQKEY